MEVHKCFFCEKDMLIKSFTGGKGEVRGFHERYGYIKTSAGKIGEKHVCTDCAHDLYWLIDDKVRDRVVDMDMDENCL